METVGNIDIFATKGVEYLIVIAYLLLLVGFWYVLAGPERQEARLLVRRRTRPAAQRWVRGEG